MESFLGGLFCLLLAIAPAKVFGGDFLQYRSAATGNWNSAATWEESSDGGGSWSAATLTPTSADDTITIRSGHTVTITGTVTYDQVTVDSGGQVTVSSGVSHTLNNGGDATDLVINGTLLNQGTWTINSSAKWTAGAGGTYIHNTTTGSSPLADVSPALNAASTFIYRGQTGLTPSVSVSGRTYGNLRFESTSGTWRAGVSGSSALTINGDFFVGAGVTYSNAMTGIMTNAGNFTIDGALTNGAGNQTYTFTGSGKTISGAAATIQFETWNVNSGASITNNRALNCSSNLTVAGTLTGTGDVNFSNAGAQTFTVTSSGVLGSLLNFTINSGSTTTFSINDLATTAGSAPLTVASGGTLKGNGGFGRPIVLNGAIAPGTSVGALGTGLQTWNPGGTNVWEINDWAGGAGVDPGWDLIFISGAGIDIQATTGNPFTIKVASLNGAVPGNMANFNKDGTNTWTIAAAQAPSNVVNFAANKFVVDYSSVSNDLAGGAFSVVHEADPPPTNSLGDAVRVKFSANNDPVALAVTNYTRLNGAALKINIADLLAARTSDPDGQARLLTTLQSVAGSMMSTNGFTLSTNGTEILYPATTNTAPDSFNYVFRDNAPYRAGDTIRYATNTITITTTNAGGVASNFVSLTTDGGTNTITFAGIPGYSYDLQRTASLSDPITWTVIGSPVTANGAGRAVFVDPAPGSPAFYRVRLHE